MTRTSNRFRGARKAVRQFWDYFSWYIISDSDLGHDIEAFLLRRLPWNLRGNKQRGKVKDAKRQKQQDAKPESMSRKKPKPKS
jgi:hypothetical protein